MNEHDVLKKNRNFYIGVGGTVLEGLLSGSLFMLLPHRAPHQCGGPDGQRCHRFAAGAL